MNLDVDIDLSLVLMQKIGRSIFIAFVRKIDRAIFYNAESTPDNYFKTVSTSFEDIYSLASFYHLKNIKNTIEELTKSIDAKAPLNLERREEIHSKLIKIKKEIYWLMRICQ